MQWHEFVFSKKRDKRLLRHLLFWMTWWLYFSLCDFLYRYPSPAIASKRNVKNGNVILGDHLFLKTFLLVALYAIACYIFLHIILPRVIKGKWFNAIVDSMVLCFFLF